MNVSDINEYMNDWLSMPMMHGNIDFSVLAGCTVEIISGVEFITYAIKKSLEIISESKNIPINILTDSELTDCNADYVIDVGFCLDEAVSGDGNQENTVYGRADKIISHIRDVNPKRVLLLSDYRFFTDGYRDCLISEGEYRNISDEDSGGNLSEVYIYENKMRESLHRYGIKCVTVRSAYIYAPGLDLKNNFLHRIASNIVRKKHMEFCHSRKRYSFCYMGDFLSTVFLGLIKCPAGQVFHAVSTPSISLERLMSVLYDKFPDNTDIAFQSEESYNKMFIDNRLAPGGSMSGDKLKFYGYKPLVNMKKGITLLVDSLDIDKSVYRFEDAYSGKLPVIKKILLNQLIEVDKICKRNNIKYFLAGGTLLGAVRHGGFIPWDDDVDIMMTRENYDRFTELVQAKLPKNSFYQTPETDKNSHYLFSKIRLNDTLLVTEFGIRFPDMHNGIFLDVVVQDKTARTLRAQKRHIFITHQLRKMAINKWKGCLMPQGSKSKHNIYKKLRDILADKLSFKTLEKLRYKVMTHYYGKKTGWLYDGAGRNIENGAFPEQWLRESIDMKFEGHLFPVPKEYDAYLTYLYGDYKRLPLMSNREVSHDMEIIDLGKYYNI